MGLRGGEDERERGHALKLELGRARPWATRLTWGLPSDPRLNEALSSLERLKGQNLEKGRTIEGLTHKLETLVRSGGRRLAPGEDAVGKRPQLREGRLGHGEGEGRQTGNIRAGLPPQHSLTAAGSFPCAGAGGGGRSPEKGR